MVLRANQKGLLLTIPANVGSWFVGLYAVYSANIPLYTIVFALNLILAIAIFSFHTLGNPKVSSLFLLQPDCYLQRCYQGRRPHPEIRGYPKIHKG